MSGDVDSDQLVVPTAARPVPRGRGGTDRTSVPRFLEVGASWAWRFVVVLAAAGVFIWIVARLRIVVVPVLISALLAAMIAPLVDLVGRAVPRLVAVWLTLIGILAALAGIGFLVQTPVRRAVDDLRSQWRTAIDDVKDWLSTGPLGLDADRVDRTFDSIGEAARNYASGLFDEPAGIARMATEIVTGVLVIAVLTFFLVKDGRVMWSWFLDRLHPARRPTVDAAGAAAFRSVQGWIRGVVITGVAEAVMVGAALFIIGVPGALPLAIITFFGAFIPIVGATLAGVLSTAVALTTEGVGTAVVVAIVFLVIQQIEGDVLLPLVMRRQISLHPAVVLLALAVGAAVAGLIGAVVAVPITAAVVAAVSAARRTGTRERLDVDPVDL